MISGFLRSGDPVKVGLNKTGTRLGKSGSLFEISYLIHHGRGFTCNVVTPHHRMPNPQHKSWSFGTLFSFSYTWHTQRKINVLPQQPKIFQSFDQILKDRRRSLKLSERVTVHLPDQNNVTNYSELYFEIVGSRWKLGSCWQSETVP